MSESENKKIRIAVDAMGGDNAPGEIVKGVVDAVNTHSEIMVHLVGRQDMIQAELQKYQYPAEQIAVVDATDIIETAEPPVMAIRKKKDSSIVVGLNMVKDGTCDAFVSAGSSGAVLVGGQFIVGRIKGVERPPLAPLIPTEDGVALLVDCGANVDARASHLLQFANMGSIYMEHVVGVKNPRVAIEKIKEGMMGTLRSKIGALLVKPALKATLKTFDASEYGGAPLLGLNGLVVKTHGSSTAKEIKNSIIQCVTFKEQHINDKINEKINMTK